MHIMQGKESKSCLSLKLIKQIKRATCKPDRSWVFGVVLAFAGNFLFGRRIYQMERKTNINSEEQAERTHIQTDRHGGHSFNCSDRNEHIVKKSLVCLLRTLSSTHWEKAFSQNEFNQLTQYLYYRKLMTI